MEAGPQRDQRHVELSRTGTDISGPSPTPKTNEELSLENESLRASLDALAQHAHQLELANRALAARGEERDKLVRSVVTGVRREVSVSPSVFLANTAYDKSARPLTLRRRKSVMTRNQ